MGRHRPASKSAPTATDLIASLTAEPVDVIPLLADLSDVPTIEIPRVGSFHRVSHAPARVRWAAGLTVAGMAASGLVAGDADVAEAQPTAATAELPAVLAPPVTREQAIVQLTAAVSAHVAQEAAQQQAAEVQAAADQAELDRRAAEKAAAEEAARKAAERAKAAAAEAVQDATETATPSRSTPASSEAAQDVTSTAPRGSGAQAIVPGSRITSGFGTRWGTLHAGVDLAAPLGSPIYTPMAGTVLKAGPASGFGNAVYIQVSNGDVLVFGHMRTMFVSAGDTVSAGEKIALVGNEGQSTGPHCHIERHIGGINGQKVDPTRFLGL